MSSLRIIFVVNNSDQTIFVKSCGEWFELAKDSFCRIGSLELVEPDVKSDKPVRLVTAKTGMTMIVEVYNA